MTSRPTVALLESARERSARQLQSAALDDSVPVSVLRDISERVKQLDMLLDLHRRRSRRLALMGSALALGTLLTALAAFRTTTAPVDAAVVATAVELHFAAADDLPDLVLEGLVTVTGIRGGEAGGGTFDGDRSGADGIRVTAREVRLQQLQLAKGSTLRIETSQESVALSITNASAVSSVMVATDGPGELSLSQSSLPGWTHKLGLTDGDLIQVSNGPTGGRAVPVRITARRLKATRPITLKSVDQIRFTRPGKARGTSPEMESSVLQAGLRVALRPEVTRLGMDDQLRISDLNAKQMRIVLCELSSIDPASIEVTTERGDVREAACPRLAVRLSGTVSDVEVAESGPLRTLKPSWLEFLKDNALIGLLWAATVFAWGTGWSAWRAFQK